MGRSRNVQRNIIGQFGLELNVEDIIDIGQEIRNKRSSNNLEDIKQNFYKALDALVDARNEFLIDLQNSGQLAFFESTGILDQLDKIFENNFTAEDNLALSLSQQSQSILPQELIRRFQPSIDHLNQIITDYQTQETKLFDRTVESIDDLERGKMAFNQNELIHQIGIVDNGIYKEFLADEPAMRQLRRDREIMRLQVGIKTKDSKQLDENGKAIRIPIMRENDPDRPEYNIRLSTRTDLTQQTFLNQLKNLEARSRAPNSNMVARLLEGEGINAYWQSFYSRASEIGNAITKKGNIRVGRINEFAMQGRLTGSTLDDLLNQGKSIDLDTLNMLYGDDQNFIYQNRRIGMSQKSIVFDKNGILEGYGFSFSSIDNAIKGTNMWADNAYDINKFQKHLNNKVLSNALLDRMSYNVPEFIDYGNIEDQFTNGESQVSNEIYNFINEVFSQSG